MPLPKNLNFYWLAFTGLAIWFLFIHSPPLLIQNDVYNDIPFAAHLAGAYLINIACIVNTMSTPSTLNGKARGLHIFVGRVGMVAGALGFVFGVVCAWWPTRDLPPTGFRIGITIGGCAQLLYQYLGYRAIKRYQTLKQQVLEIEASSVVLDDRIRLESDRDEALAEHIVNMVALFVVGCSAPGMVRLVLMFTRLPALVSLVVAIITCVLSIRPYSGTYIRRMKPLPPNAVPPMTEQS